MVGGGVLGNNSYGAFIMILHEWQESPFQLVHQYVTYYTTLTWEFFRTQK